MRLYFRDIERLGQPPGPEVGGRVFVANHSNALIDPILVITGAACEISPVAKSTLWSVPGLAWLLDRAGAVPIVRRADAPDKSTGANDELFAQIASHLAGGGNILIFPEGTSHTGPQLAPLRTGAARMLIAAAARAGTDGAAPTYQAVGLEFDARTEFRSRCLVLWGPVRSLADIPGASAGDGELAAEACVHAITQAMTADLGDLLVEADTHADRLRVARVAELLAHHARLQTSGDAAAGSLRDPGSRSLGAWSEIGRTVKLAERTLRVLDPPLVARVAAAVDAYHAAAERLGPFADPALRPPPASTMLPTWQRIALAPLAAAGFALYALPYFLPRWLARSADADAVSTFKLGAALVVYPLWAAGLVTAALVVLPAPLSLVAAALAIAAPFAALRWLDAWYLRPARVTPAERARLDELRRAALAAIAEARSRLP